MVDLTAKPFHLDEEGVRWVRDTIAGMTEEEKIGQLFVNMGSSRDEAYLADMVNRYHIGAVRYQPGPAAEIREQNRVLQHYSKIPMLIAANTESGGNGACTDGTYVGHEVKIAATGDPRYAYELGRISDVDQTIELSLEYMRGIQESGIAPAAKHFPGDGIDERDQHLSSAPNWLSCEEWDETFGKVYSALIEAGLPSIMAGHIGLPSYQKHFNPDMAADEILPATLSKELITDLLRGKLGFNGLVVTDASHMVGLTGAMKRSKLLPTSIAAGCDLFLFFNDPDEDFAWMMEGFRSGTITEERLQEALERILGTKAALGLHTKAKDEILPPKDESMARIKLPENVAVAHAMHGGAPHPAAALGALLAKRGYDVTVHELPVIFVSTACPHQLADVPQVKTYINNYDDKPFTLEALVEKLEGRSEFTGVSSTDAFCGLADTRV